MASGAFSRTVRTGLRSARRIGLTEVARRASGHLPRSTASHVLAARAGLRARSGELDAIVGELDTLVPEAELEQCYVHALQLLSERVGSDEVGDYLEFGVYTGTSLACMHRALTRQGIEHVRLVGFDSFQGLPESAATDETSRYLPWELGDYSSPIAVSREAMRGKGVDLDRVTLVKGWFEDTLNERTIEQHGIRKAGVIMIDSDLYTSAKAALDFCAPLIQDHAVVVFDEWFPATLGADNVGERRAFDEFLAANPSLSATELESYAPEQAKVFAVSRRQEGGAGPGHG
jgi:predicted O-methyltransferase YrrM